MLVHLLISPILMHLLNSFACYIENAIFHFEVLFLLPHLKRLKILFEYYYYDSYAVQVTLNEVWFVFLFSFFFRTEYKIVENFRFNFRSTYLVLMWFR